MIRLTASTARRMGVKTPKRKMKAPIPQEIRVAPGYGNSVQILLRTYSEANRRDHWAAKAKRVKAQRKTAALGVSILQRLRAPVTVGLTRIAPGRLDDDNLRSALKAVRDGVADWLGLDDGDARIQWLYDQRRDGMWRYGVGIAVNPWELARLFDGPVGTCIPGTSVPIRAVQQLNETHTGYQIADRLGLTEGQVRDAIFWDLGTGGDDAKTLLSAKSAESATPCSKLTGSRARGNASVKHRR